MSNRHDMSRPFVEPGEALPCGYWLEWKSSCMSSGGDCPCSLGGEGIYRADFHFKANYGYILREIE